MSARRGRKFHARHMDGLLEYRQYPSGLFMTYSSTNTRGCRPGGQALTIGCAAANNDHETGRARSSQDGSSVAGLLRFGVAEHRAQRIWWALLGFEYHATRPVEIVDSRTPDLAEEPGTCASASRRCWVQRARRPTAAHCGFSKASRAPTSEGEKP